MQGTNPDIAGRRSLSEVATVDRQAYRDGMSKLAAAVNIITSFDEDGPCGFTATAVCSVTDEPPTLMVCVNRAVKAYPSIRRNQVLCVNTIGPQHEALARRFSGGVKEMSKRFAQVGWSSGVTGSPVLDGAMVSFDCRVSASMAVGSHDVLCCKVLDVQHGATGASLLYWTRAFHSLQLPPGTDDD